MIYNIFILENILEIMIHSLKNLQIEPQKAYEKIKYLLSNFHIGNSIEKNKMLFYQILYIMNKCFKSFLIIQNISLDYDKNSDENYIKYDIDDNDKIFYEKERYYNFENDLCIIKNDVLKLLNKYKQFDFDSIKIESQFNDKEANIKKELLILIVLNYQIIFYLINCNLINLSQFEYILYINNNYNNMKKTQLLIDMIFMHRKKRLIILFSFLQKINDFLEITMHNNNLFLINLIKPEYLNISKNTEYYFHSLIDYSSPESKLMTIYNFLECIMYDINRNHWKNNESCFSKILFYNQNHWTFISDLGIDNYKFWESLNLLAFIIINIILIIYYKKPLSGDYAQFNEIENEQDFPLTKIWPIIHIIILFIIIMYWLFTRSKIDYFYSMTRFSNEYFSENEKLKIEEKINLLKKDSNDFSINSFFPKRSEDKTINFEKNNNCEKAIKNIFYFYSNYLKVFNYTLSTIYPFIFSMVSLFLSYWSQIFFIIPLFLIFDLFKTLSSLFALFTDYGLSLTLIALFFLLILYIFSWFGFFSFRKCSIMKRMIKITKL